jgi:hypothetical protein
MAVPFKREKASTLVTGSTANARRLVVGVTAATATPTLATQGASVEAYRFIQVVVQLQDVGATCSWQLWLYDDASTKWCLDTRIGVNGTESMAQSDADNPQINMIEVAGVSRAYVKISALAGEATGCNAWISGVTF